MVTISNVRSRIHRRVHMDYVGVKLWGDDGRMTGELRILGPIDLAGQFEWYALNVQPGGALESQPHEAGTREHLTLLTGALDVVSGDAKQHLGPGETARYAADRPHAIRNPGTVEATAWLVVVHAG